MSTDDGVKKYKQLNNELRREADKAREDWLMDQCQTLDDEVDSKGRSDVFYQKVRQLKGQNMMRKSSKAIKGMGSRFLTDKSDIKERWRKYIETLYVSERLPGKGSRDLEWEDEVDKDPKGPDLLVSEIRAAIKELTSRKAVGIDEIPAEFWKSLGKAAITELINYVKEFINKGYGQKI